LMSVLITLTALAFASPPAKTVRRLNSACTAIPGFPF
jgi:hypothetical protein